MSITAPFNRPYLVDTELEYIGRAFENGYVAGDGPFGKLAEQLLEETLNTAGKVLLTTSCTHALEMAAILLDLEPGDEVILPSYTFVTTALAFAMHGATPVFCDIRPDTLNIDETRIAALVSEKTRAIVPVHYAGVGCEMDSIMDLAQKHGLTVIEDNAHGLFGSYRDRQLGSIGHMATQSFHETKNIICGEGGALVINAPEYLERAEIIREKGTNRSNFFRGLVDKYSWVDKGSSYVLSDVLAAILYGQLRNKDKIQRMRRHHWDRYHDTLGSWTADNNICMPLIPEHCQQAYHMFYLLMPSLDERGHFIEHLKTQGVQAVFHYLPLHQSVMGKKIGRSPVDCDTSADISDRLVRLPFHTGMTDTELNCVISAVTSFHAREA